MDARGGGALDPGRGRHDARGRARGALDAAAPRAPRADVLGYLSRVTLGLIRVEYTRDERARRAAAPAVRAAALRGARVRDRPTAAASCAGGSATACSSPAARRGLPGDRRPQASRRRRARLRARRTSRSRSPTSTRRSRPGSPLVLQHHAVAHPRARHPRVPALARAAATSRSRRSGASRQRPQVGRRPVDDGARTPRRPRVGDTSGTPSVIAALAARRRLGAALRRLEPSARPVAAGQRAQLRAVVARLDRAGPCPSASASTSDSVVAPRGPRSGRPGARRRRSRRWPRRSSPRRRTRSSCVSTRSRS